MGDCSFCRCVWSNLIIKHSQDAKLPPEGIPSLLSQASSVSNEFQASEALQKLFNTGCNGTALEENNLLP